ncbi:leucine--tRNA ligase [Candidatus Zinderia endosymbiont of Aphrophora alni]|uniref:leucine--tRNA ligase n=1 Tax=Candidatus Zinderia endosymbiont of Aphrophora alni TaxID=3077951 RepID=UPI0030CDC580
MQYKYEPLIIEKKVQKNWKKKNVFKVYENSKNKKGEIKKKFFTCSMIPYPSGKLHMGHIRNYTINDILYRYLRMNKFNVLMPMGWDAFGMPAENAAIINRKSPYQWTFENIKYMKKQMKSMGFSIDWSREIITCKPEYYRWNQLMFLKMLKKGIIYKKKEFVNWDPIDKTVLANEQIINGKGWRSGALIKKKKISMYFAKITKYAPKLLENIEKKLQGWPKKVIEMQKKWIGKLKGFNIKLFYKINKKKRKIWFFIEKIEILMGATFCLISINHKLIKKIIKNNIYIKTFIKKELKNQIKNKKNIFKKGIYSGIYIYHPLTKKKIEIWISNYVFSDYNCNAKICVPTYNKEDFFFAKKYNLPIKQIINFKNKKYNYYLYKNWHKNKILKFNNKYNFLFIKKIKKIFLKYLKYKNIYKKNIIFRLHDWGISRQRYWGTPIPIIHCKQCGEIPVLEKDLPIILPKKCFLDGINNPLKKNKNFLNVICYKCKKNAIRETDTMDTFIDSSWYYMKYSSPEKNKFLIKKKNEFWMPVDQYIGGIEHAILHLLYARFWTKVMKDLNLVKFDEPFKKLITQGMILNETFYKKCKKTGKKIWFNKEEIDIKYNNNKKIISLKLKKNGKNVFIGKIEKMSKSKNNGIDPQKKIKIYGADTIRLFIIFAAPLNQDLIWSTNGINGSFKFLEKLWKFCFENLKYIKNIKVNLFNNNINKNKKFNYKIHKILQNSNFNYKHNKYNTIVSNCMKMLTIINKFSKNCKKENLPNLKKNLSILLRILYPISPHITSTLWINLKFTKEYGDILDAPWPKINKDILKYKKNIIFPIYINGKFQKNILILKNLNKNEIKKIIFNSKKILDKIKKKKILKIIFIPNKIFNIVII